MSRSGRILVVDDEGPARTALAELLRGEGFEVETAADAFKALGKCGTFAPQIVFTDLKMPGMDGIDLIGKLRANDQPPIVIVLTAFATVASAVESMRAGAADYLTKPISFDELLEVLDSVFNHLALERDALNVRNTREIAPSATQSGTDMPRVPGSTLADIERYAIIETLKSTGGSTSKAAEILGISVRTIQYRLHEYSAAPRSNEVAVVVTDDAGTEKSG